MPRLIGPRTAWVIGAACVVWSGAWVASGWSYPLDVLASFQAWVLLGTVVCAVVLMLCRRFGPAALAGAGLLIGVWPLAAGRAPALPGVDLTSPPGPGLVRVVSMNIDPNNPVWGEELERVLGWHADAVVVIEVPPELNRGIRRRGLLDDRGWGWAHREWADGFASPCFVLSPWPIERLEVAGVAHAERDILLTRIEAPSGAVLVAAAHPQSPRTLWRWRIGNEIWGRTADALARERAERGLPLAVGVDLNAGPAAWRARAARRAGLRAGKPWTGGWGTYDAQWTGPARVQIDDIWHAGADLVAWSSVEPLGSNHRVIVSEIRVRGSGQGAGGG